MNPSRRRASSRHPHVVGSGVAAAAVGAQWLLHTARPRVPFAPFSVGDWLIRHAPAGLATSAIDALGHDAQRILATAVVLGAVLLGAAIGARRPVVLAGVAVVASLGATALDPRQPTTGDGLAAALVAGAAAFFVAAASAPPQTGGSNVAYVDVAAPSLGRRRVIAALAAVAGGLVLGGSALRRSLRHVPPSRVRADHPARRFRDPAFDAVPGLSPAVSTRDDHYVVDIDLDDPVLDEATWRLTIDGLVDRPLSLTLDDLRAMPTTERTVTLSCISNPVGGPLVGNARWTGVTVSSLLELARARRDASCLHVEAADGYHESFPIELLRADGTLVAVAMNGSTLPRGHGSPARLLVPGRYGMKNVKWLSRLVLADEPAPGYWVQRGWDPDGVVQTESRIDTPADHATLAAGDLTIAGIAWAGTRGVDRVEVSADDGATWHAADLEAVLDPLAWRRWKVQLVLPPGTFPISVRATDGTGAVQVQDRRAPHPAGATGWHRITLTLR